MNIVVAGHVDHGKSTLLGRLLADGGVISEEVMGRIRLYCERNNKAFEYSFLLDALKEEQQQGITMDVSRTFFKTPHRNIMFFDAPGHVELLKNMLTGASKAHGALLILDALEGLQENTKRHLFLLSFLGLKQICVVINKIDLVQYSQTVYEQRFFEISNLAQQIGLGLKHIIPASGYHGENITFATHKMPWYQGVTVLDVIDSFKEEVLDTEKPFRMFIQDIYRFDSNDHPVAVGQIESGEIQCGDEVIFYPSLKKAKVKAIQIFNELSRKTACAGENIGLVFDESVDLNRGELIGKKAEASPIIDQKFKVQIFWLSPKTLSPADQLWIKVGTNRRPCFINRIIQTLNTSDLIQNTEPQNVYTNELANIELFTSESVAWDAEKAGLTTARVTLMKDFETVAVGHIL